MFLVEDLELLMADQEEECINKYSNVTLPGIVACPLSWDSLLCWPPTPAGKTILMPCPSFDSPYTSLAGVFATRTCNVYGEWLGNRTDFTQCLRYIEENGKQSWAPTAVAMVLLIGSFVSIIALTASLIVFMYFRKNVFAFSQNCGSRV